MPHTTHSARVNAPISYTSADGRRASIPVGPCLIEEVDGEVVDVVWGRQGERSTVLPVQAVEAAEESGDLVLLD